MPDVKISAGADPGTLVATDKVPLARSASTTAYAATMAELATYANGSYVPNYFTGTPSMDGTGAAGTAAFVSRGDHVHPTDTTRMSKAGTTTNDNAAAGQVGEYISSTSGAVSLTNATQTTVTSISLTAGDWDVWGTLVFGGTAASLSNQQAGINTVAATLPGGPAGLVGLVGPLFSAGTTLNVPTIRMSLASTTTVYLVVFSAFPSGTSTATGIIAARRVR